jgi:sulfotransferase family protein
VDVSLAEPDPERLASSGLESVTNGDSTYALEVEGWALGRQLPVVSVELIHERNCLRRVAPDVGRPDLGAAHPDLSGIESSGYYASVSPLALEIEFELLVRAALQDKTRVEIGTIRGSRTPLETSFEPRLRPLMITSLGRTGSNALARLLNAHPQIVAYRPFQYEPRVGTYWMGILRALSEPASYRRQIEAAGKLDAVWWLGREEPVPRKSADGELDRWLGVEGVEALATFCQSRIEELYAQIAGRAQKPNAAYFAEKFRADSAASLMRELYPTGRELIVVRDFRDMLSSMLAFNAKRGVEGFRRDRAGSDVEFIEENMGNSAWALANAWQRRSDRAHLVRYEDFVLKPKEMLESLLTYLGLDAGESTLTATLAAASQPDSAVDAHRTAASPEASIGRWQHDLTPEQKRACEAALGPALETFGYLDD